MASKSNTISRLVKIPLLITVRIPDRAPPTLSAVTDHEVSVQLTICGAPRASVTITPAPHILVREFLEETFYYLADEVLPDTLKVKMSWKGPADYKLGLSASLVFALVRSLESYYMEHFSDEDLIGILTSLYRERGIGSVESNALARSLVKSSSSLVSSSGESVELGTLRLRMKPGRELQVSPLIGGTVDSELLDLLAKASSLTVFKIASMMVGNNLDNSRESLLLSVRFYNNIWKTLYDVKSENRENSYPFIIAPSLPGTINLVSLLTG